MKYTIKSLGDLLIGNAIPGRTSHVHLIRDESVGADKYTRYTVDGCSYSLGV